MKKTLCFLFAIAISFSSCEKDDICDASTPTTPRLVIAFFDIANPSVPKNVTNLKVIGAGKTEGVVFNPTATGEAQYLTNSNKILIPLQVTENSSSFSFTLNSGNSNPLLVNLDNLKFNYTHNDFFVSRACGFKSLFTMDSGNPVIHTDATVLDQKWIKFISVERDNIDNENDTHIKIFF